MIAVTRLNGTQMMVNADLIETLEATPDTVMTLTNEHKFVIRESIDEVVARVIAFKRQVFGGVFASPGVVPGEASAL
jgi:flagellar protein FlbD